MSGAAQTVFERMVAVVDELPAIGKTDYNEQQKFHFRGHDAVLNALNPLLAKHGVFVVPNVLERCTSERTTRSGSAMFEVSLHVAFTFYGAAGDSFTGSTWGEGTDMGDKATSKAMTMAFKSMIGQAFAISTAENADPDASMPEESAPRSGATQDSGSAVGGSGAGGVNHVTPAPTTSSGPAPTEKQLGFLRKLMGEAGVTDLGKPLDQLTKSEASGFIEQFKSGTFNPPDLAATGAGFVDDDIPFDRTIDGLGG